MDSHQVHQLLKIRITFAIYNQQKVISGCELGCRVEMSGRGTGVGRADSSGFHSNASAVGSWQAALEHATVPEEALRHGVTKQAVAKLIPVIRNQMNKAHLPLLYNACRFWVFICVAHGLSSSNLDKKEQNS